MFRRLTGGGDFCSEAHRRAYHAQLNQVALTRLTPPKPRQEDDRTKPVERGVPTTTPTKPTEADPPPLATFFATSVAAQAGALMRRGLPMMQPPLHDALEECMPAGELKPKLEVPPVARTLVALARSISNAAQAEIRWKLKPVSFEIPSTASPEFFDPGLCTTGFEERTVSDQPSAIGDEPEEAIPPQAKESLPFRLAAGQPPAAVIGDAEPLPLTQLDCVIPEFEMLPLRPAITFTAPPQLEPEPLPPITEAEVKPAPARMIATSASAEPEPLAIPELTLGLPAGVEMGSPILRAWWSISPGVKVAVAAILIAAIAGMAVWKSMQQRSSSSATGFAASANPPGFTGGNISMGGSGWITDWAGDASGSKRGRQLTLYTPSMVLKDYRVEFVGQIESRSLGWVIRAKDTNNYYGMKIRIVRPGIEPDIVLTRYPVIDGIEGPGVDVPLNLTVRNDTMYKVQVEVRGPRFTTTVLGKAVDVWTDERLAGGGFGFSNERVERAHIRNVSISF